MSTAVRYPHLAKDTKRGLVIEGTRLTVLQLAIEHLEYGWSAYEIHENHPGLDIGAVHSALAYYFDHREEMDQEMAKLAKREEGWRRSSKQPTRAELLKRLRS
jgi:uncharacterized protein (DUF433 family)